MTPSDLLLAARSLMERPDAAADGAWPRASALLARQAVEAALDQVWMSHKGPGTHGLVQCSMRTQLVCAPSYVDADVAAWAAWTWATLSQACHHHSYELAPTAAELESWMAIVATVIQRLDPHDAGTVDVVPT